MAQRCFGAKASGTSAITRARRAADSSQSGRSWPSSSAERDGAAQAVADRRRAGEQGEAPRRAVGVAGPEDLAARRLQVEDEVDRLLDDRPHRLDEAAVLGEQPAVPHAGGHVGAHVGVELVLLHRGAAVRRRRRSTGATSRPRAGGRRATRRPGRPRPGGRRGRGPWPPRRGSRGRVAAREPRDHPRGQLPLGDAVHGGVEVGGGDEAGDVDGHGLRPSRWASWRRRRGSCRAPG